jgi:DNA-binding response OmpR family regulator
MSNRVVRLLHVEDCPMQRKVTAHHLRRMPDLQFDVVSAESEDAAVETFGRGGFEFVLLDYHLSAGNGLNCLRKMRKRHATVPIVAVSGVATPEIAAELLQEGADDYLSKLELTADALERSVRMALKRFDAWRKRAPAGSAVADPLGALGRRLGRAAARPGGAEVLGILEEFSAAARLFRPTAERLREVLTHDGGETLSPQVVQLLIVLAGAAPN